MESRSQIIAVTARIDEDNQLVLTVQGGDHAPLRPNAGIEDLLVERDGPITVEVTDFFQCGTVYDIYGATLGADGHAVATHWEATGRGQRTRFVVSSAAEARATRFVVGATPRRSSAPVPVPFTSWRTPGGSSPSDVDPGKGPVSFQSLRQPPESWNPSDVDPGKGPVNMEFERKLARGTTPSDVDPGKGPVKTPTP